MFYFDSHSKTQVFSLIKFNILKREIYILIVVFILLVIFFTLFTEWCLFVYRF